MLTRKNHSLNVSRSLAVACVLVPLMAAAQTPERSRTEGLKETDRFIKAGGATSESVAAAKLEVQKALTAYNTLVTQPSKDMKGDYKKLLKSMDSMNKKMTDAQAKISTMQSAADTYFQGRGATIKNIQDPALQTQAQQRMAASQKEFDGVLTSLREAGGALEPFRKQLEDQIHYLGSDLNPSAATSLKPQADKLNADGTTAFTRADDAVSTANTYFTGLKGQAQ